jgi:hypothetical protein
MESLGALNEKFQLWLENDYQRKPHAGLGGKTPLDVFLAQSMLVTLVTDLSEFNEKFMVRVKRTIKKDATISLDGALYETDMSLAGMRVDVRYDPDPESSVRELFIFSGDTPKGTARLVSFNDNAKRRRKGGGAGKPADEEGGETSPGPTAPIKEHTITYSEM